jgi:hypothetical protein
LPVCAVEITSPWERGNWAETLGKAADALESVEGETKVFSGALLTTTSPLDRMESADNFPVRVDFKSVSSKYWRD